MFRGTMKVKAERGSGAGGPGGAASVPLTLEELDRPSHCPESVDEDSWLHLVKIRRAKIDSEKGIARLESDIAETEAAVGERAAAAETLDTQLATAVEGLEVSALTARCLFFSTTSFMK